MHLEHYGHPTGNVNCWQTANKTLPLMRVSELRFALNLSLIRQMCCGVFMLSIRDRFDNWAPTNCSEARYEVYWKFLPLHADWLQHVSHHFVVKKGTCSLFVKRLNRAKWCRIERELSLNRNCDTGFRHICSQFANWKGKWNDDF